MPERGLHTSAVHRWPAEIGLAAMCFGRRGERLLLGIAGERVIADDAASLPAALRRVTSAGPSPSPSPHTGWLGWISYDAGRVLDPAVERWHAGDSVRAARDRDLPLAEFVRIDGGVVLEAGRNAADWFGKDEATARIREALTTPAPAWSLDFAIENLTASGHNDYCASVGRVIEYIRAGDVYQVNLAHRLSCGFRGSVRGLFAAMLHRASPWHGGYFESPHYQLVSASPELFLEFDAETRRVTTRPMKGTRPLSSVDSHNQAMLRELERSEKDRAELAMIVDLMRNDLGRVCTPGTMSVNVPREIEWHDAGVLQATATVSGTLAPGLTRLDLLHATFPAGSVTGAPKVRAMQIIDELEPVRRGPYCGSMVWLGDDGSMKATVLIRTAVISGGGAFQAPSLSGGGAFQAPSLTGGGAFQAPPGAFLHQIADTRAENRSSSAPPLLLEYSVGAGIVSDSKAAKEWLETLDKAAFVKRLGPMP